MIPSRAFANKTVAVFGLARTGLGAVRALVAGGTKVIAWDDSSTARDLGGLRYACICERRSRAYGGRL